MSPDFWATFSKQQTRILHFEEILSFTWSTQYHLESFNFLSSIFTISILCINISLFSPPNKIQWVPSIYIILDQHNTQTFHQSFDYLWLILGFLLSQTIFSICLVCWKLNQALWCNLQIKRPLFSHFKLWWI